MQKLSRVVESDIFSYRKVGRAKTLCEKNRKVPKGARSDENVFDPRPGCKDKIS